jgi:23S rRNA (adenine2503-C2)-methyltransferase
MQIGLFGLTFSALEKIIESLGEKSFRARQIFEWIYQKKAKSWDEMTNLSKTFRSDLSQKLTFSSLKYVRHIDSGTQETTKYLWELSDGKLVESVLIRAPDRKTVCVSSQVGCPARCAFCASGKKGLIRNLTVAEIVEQVIQTDRLEPVTHVVFMGMGEPFENYDNVVEAINLLNHPLGLNISQRKITVSTVGIVEKIVAFAKEDFRVNLVLSLHAPNQHLRKKIIPYARKYELSDLLDAMLFYAKETGRDITYEYTMLAGLNDSLEHAEELAQLVKGHPCTINLIPYNPVEGLRLNRPTGEAIEAFRALLDSKGLTTTWRYTKGKDIAAACGQLALQQSL